MNPLPNPLPNPLHVVYWARLGLARRELTEAMAAVPGCVLNVVDQVDDCVQALAEADALVLYDAPQADAKRVVDAIAAAGRLRWMHFVSAGREGFVAAGLPAGVAISYAAGGVSPTVAEHAMALLLALARRVPEMVLQQAQSRWDRQLALRAVSLEGMTLAIVGTGHIGIELARRARAFGMRTVGLSRGARPDPALTESHPLDARLRVFAEADAVVVAIALTADTRHLVGAAELAACRRGALLVNIARGGVIDQAALIAALESGHIGGAGLDVTSPEPLPAEDALWRAPNVLISPHFAGSGSAASTRRLAQGAAANLRRLLAGEPLHGVVQR